MWELFDHVTCVFDHVICVLGHVTCVFDHVTCVLSHVTYMFDHVTCVCWLRKMLLYSSIVPVVFRAVLFQSSEFISLLHSASPHSTFLPTGNGIDKFPIRARLLASRIALPRQPIFSLYNFQHSWNSCDQWTRVDLLASNAVRFHRVSVLSWSICK